MPLFARAKQVLITLRFSILSIFVSLFVASILILITINYFYTSKTLLYTAKKLMHEISTTLYREFSRELQAAEKDDALSAEYLSEGVIDSNNFQQIISYTYNLANRFYLVQAAYWLDDKGNFIITKYENDDSLTTIIFNVRNKSDSKEIIYRDIKGNIIKREKSNVVYDPTKRPWYLAAKEQKKTIWTDIYLFAPTPYLGITVATPVFKNNTFLGVFGLDVRLDWLSWYVGEQKITPNGITFIVDMEGDVLAFPGFDKLEDQTKLYNIHDLNTPWIAKSFEIYQKNKENEFDFTYEGKDYLAVYQPVPNVARQNWLIGVVVPHDDFVGDLKKTSLINIIISISILILAIFLVSSLVTRVVKPIKKLVHETEKIKNFDLDEEKPIQSRIKEIMYLADALYAMKLGLKSFQKYVPASLVRQLIDTHQNARIGGTKLDIAVLFTDIKNFTLIAENMDPDHLMKLMCEYFDALSKIIIDLNGTIDKYIGDSIMAFWGAPLPVNNPSHKAASAALSCLRKLNELNTQWSQQGEKVLVTRFGIHAGNAIVGNLGSSERMNYTALGDTINIASRLEGVNKIYGTQILVSEQVYSEIKNNFILRLVDYVNVKGKTKNIFIYELIAEKKSELSFDVDQYQKIFQQAFSEYRQQHWQLAIEHFSECLVIYSNDSLAPLFISRCEHFKNNPPHDWDGAWSINEK